MANKSELWNKFKKSAAEGFIESFWETVKEDEARKDNERREYAIQEGIKMLCDAQVSEEKIINILNRRYGYCEADVYPLINDHLKVCKPCEDIESYLVKECHYLEEEAAKFIFDNNIPESLRNDWRLSKLSPKQLLKRLGLENQY